MVTAAGPDAVDEETSAAEAVLASSNSAGVEAEQSVIETVTELGSGGMTAVEASVDSAVIMTDTAGSLENAQAAESGELQPTAGDPMVDAGPGTESGQSVLAAETLVDRDATAAPTAEPGVAKEKANAVEVIPTAAESVRGSAGQETAEAANEVGSGDMTPAEADIATPALTAVTAGLFDTTSVGDETP